VLAELLGRHTSMPVHTVEDGMAVAPNEVYVIRPGNTLTLERGLLRLGASVERRGHRRPIDDFFRSLAAEQKERAICIVMSGMGSNGTAGAQAIKAAGGICIAQDPTTAEFPTMPQSLIDAGYADQVLAPADMPAALVSFIQHPYVAGSAPEASGSEQALAKEGPPLNEILAILRTRTGRDFRGYKRPTLLRRMQRRMGLAQVTRLADYAELLRRKPEEVVALADDLTINVTGFFRDAEAWEALRTHIVRPLFESREPNTTIRAWVAGCSSGEEAYTLAILLAEEADAVRKQFDIKIFATDTAEKTLGMAPRRTLSGRHRRGPRAAAHRALLREGRAFAAGEEGAARDGGVRSAESADGSAVLASRSGHVPESPDLSRARYSAAHPHAHALRAPRGRHAVSGELRNGGRSG
jgi:two-component system CheB/CheR fusion protein